MNLGSLRVVGATPITGGASGALTKWTRMDSAGRWRLYSRIPSCPRGRRVALGASQPSSKAGGNQDTREGHGYRATLERPVDQTRSVGSRSSAYLQPLRGGPDARPWLCLTEPGGRPRAMANTRSWKSMLSHSADHGRPASDSLAP